MGFSRQEYWSRLPFPSPGDLPDSGTEPRSPELQADSLPSDPPGKSIMVYYSDIKPFAETWMDLETVIQSELSQKKKKKYHIASIWNLKKHYK